MKDCDLISAVLITASELAKREGTPLNKHDTLIIRTRAGEVLAAKKRHRQRMTATAFEWTANRPPR